MFSRLIYDVPSNRTRMTDEDLDRFAKNLYKYLYFKLKMNPSNLFEGPNLREIGNAVFCVRNSLLNFIRGILDKSRSCGSKGHLCQIICDLYPDTDYFKKLFFISAFILELVYYWDEGEDNRDLSLGPNFWQMIFRRNFEGKFENNGGWTGLLDATTLLHDVPLSGHREYILPVHVEGVISRFRELCPILEDAAVDEASASIERIQMGENQPGILGDRPGPSGLGRNVFQCETIASLERLQAGQMEENRPGKVAKVEELNEENQPEALPSTSRLGGNATQTGHLGESSSGKSGEGVLHKLGDRHQRKRSRKVPSKTDSGKKSDSPIPTKTMKEEGDGKHDSPPKSGSDRESDSVSSSKAKTGKEDDGGKSLRKRKHDSPPKSDSDSEPDSVSPSKAKEGKM